MPSLLGYLPAVLAVAGSVIAAPTNQSSAVNTTVCNGQTYVYEEMAGYGYLVSDYRDRYGDSISLGSSIAIDRSTWSQKGNVYEGIMYALPGKFIFSSFYVDIGVKSTSMSFHSLYYLNK